MYITTGQGCGVGLETVSGRTKALSTLATVAEFGDCRRKQCYVL